MRQSTLAPELVNQKHCHCLRKYYSGLLHNTDTKINSYKGKSSMLGNISIFPHGVASTARDTVDRTGSTAEAGASQEQASDGATGSFDGLKEIADMLQSTTMTQSNSDFGTERVDERQC